MIEHIKGNIYRIFVPLPRNPLKYLNSYFIRGEGRSLLIDTGFRQEACRTALEEGLKELGADMDRTDIFLTHVHADHSGLAPSIASEDTRIFISSTDAVFLEIADRAQRWKSFDVMYLSEGFPLEEIKQATGHNPARDLSPEAYSKYIHMEDGDMLHYGGHDLKCILTPGHTPGHMCLYDEKEKIMFLGDHVLFDITPNIVRWVTVENSLKNYLENLKKISGYEIELPLPAHREVSGTVKERAENIRKHHEVRLQEALNAIREYPGMTAYQTAGHMTWDVRSDSWETFPLAQKWFAVGETLSHLDYLRLEGKIRREERDGVGIYFAV
ncbi:MBL fold metallo-hydrolase [Papillibacter cinnamivorans]|uniref:Glyoxylase, beta-lactamase superfamily II n=1 Tax=Papillibacter cinnamivorans DSM 12816 TaxID=1122930 RepID=A0A1W2BWR5_9FIRM|nr:MBL fold metallo-hydrolase [Papillibacter cinnamivorans]SMC77042.1 Glyoxylase, beta-lactamase superfamily II [Papillibacter cinnamivorans DSM 12816]